MTAPAALSRRERELGLLWGLVVGDALGSPVQFTGKDDHPRVSDMMPCRTFGTPPGFWTDDSSMAFCIAESFARLGRHDLADIARNFVRWHDHGFWSSLPHAFDVGGATSAACRAIARTGSLANGTEDSQGNGSVMRLAPSYLVSRALGKEDILLETSDLTHRSRRVRETVLRMAGVLDEIFATGVTTARSPWRTREEVDNSGWCVSTVEAALWAVAGTSSFEEALLAAVNLGGDADTIGAVAGQFAGAMYGFSAIPARWLAPLAKREAIAALFDSFLSRLPPPPAAKTL